MKYSSDNINGLSFKSKGDEETVYTIKKGKIQWRIYWEESGKEESIGYGISNILHFFECEQWQPLRKKEE